MARNTKRSDDNVNYTVDPKDWADFWECPTYVVDVAFVESCKPKEKKRKKK